MSLQSPPNKKGVGGGGGSAPLLRGNQSQWWLGTCCRRSRTWTGLSTRSCRLFRPFHQQTWPCNPFFYTLTIALGVGHTRLFPEKHQSAQKFTQGQRRPSKGMTWSCRAYLNFFKGFEYEPAPPVAMAAEVSRGSRRREWDESKYNDGAINGGWERIRSRKACSRWRSEQRQTDGDWLIFRSCRRRGWHSTAIGGQAVEVKPRAHIFSHRGCFTADHSDDSQYVEAFSYTSYIGLSACSFLWRSEVQRQHQTLFSSLFNSYKSNR